MRDARRARSTALHAVLVLAPCAALPLVIAGLGARLPSPLRALAAGLSLLAPPALLVVTDVALANRAVLPSGIRRLPTAPFSAHRVEFACRPVLLLGRARTRTANGTA
jgi:hypothetical protein